MDRIPWWFPLAFLCAAMAVSGVGSAVWDGPVPPSKFGNAAEWAAAFGTVLAVTLALFQRGELVTRRGNLYAARQASASAAQMRVAISTELQSILDRASAIRLQDGQLDKSTLADCVRDAIRVLQPFGELAAAPTLQLELLAARGAEVRERPTSANESDNAQQWCHQICETIRSAQRSLTD